MRAKWTLSGLAFAMLGLCFATASSQLVPGDHSHFVRDVTYPDYPSSPAVAAGSHIIKKWEVQNDGSVNWTGRYVTSYAPKGFVVAARTKIPDTKAGHNCIIAVPMTVPTRPGLWRADFKQTDGRGRLYFPDQKPIYISIMVRKR